MTNSVIQKFLLFVFFGIVVSACSLEVDSTITAKEDIKGPLIIEVTAITTPDNDTTPDYTFSSDEAGIITYGGSCSSSTTDAVSGNNTITLNFLTDGTYSDCTISVPDNVSNVSILNITSFEIDTKAPTIDEVVVVSTPTINSTPNYTFSSDETGTITYGGSCSSTTTDAASGNNTITLNSLSDGTYSDCTITVTDTAGNISNKLTLTSFSVLDQMGGSFQGFELSLSAIVTTLAGDGSGNAIDGTGTSASFNSPYGITTDGTNLYVTDRHKIRKIVISTGVVTTFAGSYNSGAQNGQGENASFYWPLDITTDGTNLYVADKSNFEIRQIVISTGVVTTLAGTGWSGSTNGTGTAASFTYPTGITTDGTNLYVTDKTISLIRQIVISTGVVTTLAGTGFRGSTDGTGTSASFNYPSKITTDGTNLYVSEIGGNLIRQIVISTGVVTTLAGTGWSGSTDGTGTSASFSFPRSITTDGTNLYVAEQSNQLIRKIVISTGVVTTLAGDGAKNSIDGTGTSASFNSPYGITTDGTNLYVTEEGGSLIRKIE